MDVEWNQSKARTNEQKHGVSFLDALTVLSDMSAVTIADHVADEERLVSTGMDCHGRILVVVYIYRDGDTIRIISARRATRNERKQYRG
ncbi:MAG: BrnT family toxin [Magnetococcus sp. DMHC-8]